MSTQIAVRLPDELVGFVDSCVTSGAAPSRARVVARALERERRRVLAERDAEILRADAARDDMEGLSGWASSKPLDIG
ncbi:MAG: hypothetical protein FWF28_10930 [Micrococcales bacterium]|nr:hypothetical protein [Micrococcales bacterium]